jgi:hypothetical protein
VVFSNVDNGVVRNCQAQPGTAAFLHVADGATKDVVVVNNDFRQAQTAVTTAPEANPVGNSW